MKLCVFCGASTGKSPAYRLAAIELGHAMADAGIGLVYGGASVGLMGAVADAVLERGAKSSASFRASWPTRNWPTRSSPACTSWAPCTSARP